MEPGKYANYNATAAPGMMKKGSGGFNPTGQQYGAQGSQNGGLYTGYTTGGQEAANYATNLNRNGVSNLYVGQTTGGQEAANDARNQQILRSGMNATQISNMQNVIPFTQGGGGAPASDPRRLWAQNFLASHRPPSATQKPAERPAAPTGPTPIGPPGGSGTGNLGTVTSTIDSSTPLYTDEQTRAYTTQMASQARQMGSPRVAMKKFSRPGMAHDEGTLAAALPQITAARAAANNLRGTIPLQDAFANQQFALQGQVAAGQETNQLARLLQQLQGTQDTERNSAMQAILNPLMGSMFG